MTEQRGTRRQSHASQPDVAEVFHRLGLERAEERDRILAPIEFERPIKVPGYYAIKVSGSTEELHNRYDAMVNA